MVLLAIRETKEAQQAAPLTLGTGIGFVHKQDPDRSLVDATDVIEVIEVESAVVIEGGANRKINPAAIVEVTNAGDGCAKMVITVQDAVEDTLRVRDLLQIKNFSVFIDEQD